MPRFAANLSVLFTEWPFLERFEAAAAAGFEAVEFLFPYDCPAPDVAEAIGASGVQPLLLNTPPGNWDAGERGLAALPGRQREFRDSFEKALDYATKLSVPQVHVMAGILTRDADEGEAEEIFAENLSHAAEVAMREDIQILIEPINDCDVLGYFLTRCDQARRIIERVGAPNLFLQFDCYHVAIMEREIRRHFEENLGLIRHIQISGNPGRHEPDESQDIDYSSLFELFDVSSYKGWVSCEYSPRLTTLEGLGWAARYGLGHTVV